MPIPRAKRFWRLLPPPIKIFMSATASQFVPIGARRSPPQFTATCAPALSQFSCPQARNILIVIWRDLRVPPDFAPAGAKQSAIVNCRDMRVTIYTSPPANVRARGACAAADCDLKG